MQITVSGLEALDSLSKYGRQIPYAISRAINTTMSGAHKAVQAEIRDVFDRPTSMVQKGVRWSASTKRDLTAKIYLSSGGPEGRDVGAILMPHITGEDRIVKASERRLRRHGLMGQGQWMVPGPGAPLDSYGNISGSYMKKLLAQLQADTELGYNKMSRKASRRGVGTLYAIPFTGVFRRTGPRSSIPVLIFTYKKPKYEAGMFDFYYVVQSHFNKNFGANFSAAFKAAAETAR